ncbi:MAG TPA: hypothetical protein DCW29_25140 [Janthinobacterium sp.]|nr:hypothetical protein [Janthinobacterium sp.]
MPPGPGARVAKLLYSGKTLCAALLVLCAGGALAGPAPWYQWASKIDATLVCRQTSPGPGWEKAYGPYRDSHCEKRALAK